MYTIVVKSTLNFISWGKVISDDNLLIKPELCFHRVLVSARMCIHSLGTVMGIY